jgi:hypothetical protein
VITIEVNFSAKYLILSVFRVTGGLNAKNGQDKHATSLQKQKKQLQQI